MDLRSLPGQWIFCRAFGHRWEDLGGLMMKTPYGSQFIQQKWHCACGCERTDSFTPRSGLRIGHPQYFKPDGYYGIPQADARAEWFQRNAAKADLKAVK